MVRAEDIHDDAASLEAWLDARPGDDDARRKVAVQIAHRAAMRHLPDGWHWFAYAERPRERGLTPLPILRANLICDVAAVYSTPQIREVAAAAASAADSAAWEVAAIYITQSGAFTAANAASSAAHSTFSDGFTSAAAQAGSARSGAVDCHSDASAIEAGRDLRALPLWLDRRPGLENWKWIERDSFPPDSPYDFWRRWYLTHLDPATYPPMPPEMLRDIALIDPKIWESTPEELAKEIARIEAAYEDPPTQPDVDGSTLEQAIDRTPYGERVEVNPDTGALRVVPDSDLPEDIVGIVKRKLAGAAAIFDHDHSNQYTGCMSELDLLREVIATDPILPVELFDTCASVVKRMTIRIENGDIPGDDKDPLIADFMQRVRQAGADIFANDPKTRDMFAALNAFAENDALLEAREDVQAGADQIAEVAEGALQRDLPLDADQATDPDTDPETRKRSGYRLVSRVVRVAFFVIGAAAAGVGVTANVTALAESQWFMALFNAALKYIGL